jgi:hypothetical protein
MSQVLWTPALGMAPIAYQGHIEMRDMHIPVPGKDEWGMDTLTRTVRGPASLQEQFIRSLRQGTAFRFANSVFYLQTWAPQDHPIFPGASMSYKGLTNGIPGPIPSNSRTELVGSITATDLSVTYHGKTIVSAQKEVKYIAPQTTYRYISKREPQKPSFSGVRGGSDVQVLDSRITATFSDGTTQVFAGGAPAAVATALAGSAVVFVVGPNATPIVGTPYWEAEETCMLKYPGS